MEQKPLGARGNMLSIECQVTVFAPLYVCGEAVQLRIVLLLVNVVSGWECIRKPAETRESTLWAQI